MFYVYYLRSLKDASHYYVGYSANLKKRVSEHNSGSSKATKPYYPWQLIFYEAYLDKKDAKRISKPRKEERL